MAQVPALELDWVSLHLQSLHPIRQQTCRVHLSSHLPGALQSVTAGPLGLPEPGSLSFIQQSGRSCWIQKTSLPSGSQGESQPLCSVPLDPPVCSCPYLSGFCSALLFFLASALATLSPWWFWTLPSTLPCPGPASALHVGAVLSPSFFCSLVSLMSAQMSPPQ